MIAKRAAVLIILGVALAACGGSGRKPPQPPTPPPAPAEVQVAISSPAVNVELGQGDLFRATLAGTWSARNLGSGQVYLQVSDSGNTFVLPEAQLAPAGGSFSYSLPLSTTVGAGPRSGSLAIRACRDVACAQPYEGASATLAYQLRVTAVREWETEQGNAAHDGYVPVTLDPARFAPLWSWTESRTAIDSLVTSAGAVHGLIFQSEAGRWVESVATLDAATGDVRWTTRVGSGDIAGRQQATFAGALAAGAGRLYYQVVFSPAPFCLGLNPWECGLDQGSEVRSIAVADGALLMTSPWRPYGTDSGPFPVVYGDSVFMQGRTSLRAYDPGGGVRWETAYAQPFFPGNYTPAVDHAHVYSVSAGKLQILERASGAVLASIGAPPGEAQVSAPMLGGRGNVIAYVWPEGLSDPMYQPRRLASLDIAGRVWSWTTTAYYVGQPVAANGVVYARRDSPMGLDAIDEATGAVLWTWVPPSGADQFSNNLVVTRNLLFVGTTTGTHAVELATGRLVWELPRPGLLALSAGRVLYIAPRNSTTSGNEPQLVLTAVRLQ